MISRKALLLIVAVLALAALVAACGPGGGTSGGGGNALNVTITATEFKYDPNTISAAPGQSVTVTLKNAGTIQHTFVLKDANVKITADPGQSQSATFTAPAAGTYTFDCDVPGHADAGMKGTLTVK